VFFGFYVGIIEGDLETDTLTSKSLSDMDSKGHFLTLKTVFYPH